MPIPAPILLMMGIDPNTQRDRMAEALDVIRQSGRAILMGIVARDAGH